MLKKKEVKITVIQNEKGIKIEGTCSQEVILKTVIGLMQYLKPETWEVLMTRLQLADVIIDMKKNGCLEIVQKD